MADEKQWTTPSNDAVYVRLLHRSGAPALHSHFHPAFTYPIFGDEEVIFGYRDLRVQLDFAADTLRPRLRVGWREKYAPVGETVADDVRGALREFVPSAFENQNAKTTKATTKAATVESDDAEDGGDADVDDATLAFDDTPDAETFEPPGELVQKYSSQGRNFGIWASPLSDPRTKQILRNMQVFVPFFIEGGTLISLDDPQWSIERWRVYFLYAIDPDPTDSSQCYYSLAGYSTAYRLFTITDPAATCFALSPGDESPMSALTPQRAELPSQLPSRMRISQFIILPPFQAAGHGSRLYTAMYSAFLRDTAIVEITVEDPNESFDDMRDVNDFLRLSASADFSAAFARLSVNPDAKLPASPKAPLPTGEIIDEPAAQALRAAAKLAPRQFARLLELALLAAIPAANRSVARLVRRDRATNPHDRAYFFWRLLVKRRLTTQHRELLAQLPADERIERLDQTLASVEQEYDRLGAMVQKRLERAMATGEIKLGPPVKDDTDRGPSNGTALPRRAGAKRKVVDDDDDDDDDDDAQSVTSMQSASKKAKGAPA